EAILTLDADGQHDPAEIPRFLEAWGHGPADAPPDLVIGTRNFRAMPPLRRLSNVLGGTAFSWAVGRSIADNQSGYRLVSRRLAEATLASDEPGFAFEVEQITTCIRMGGRLETVPIRTIYAGAPSHIRPIPHLREFIRIVRQARRDVRTPLP
ncbi:MAG TPA: glycosyltransferase family 2 protein, partial [Patescibacteria group bacterium]|nr:glycosyltransferase family 2 protein [Patescibacteria group bacterium]